MQAGMSYPAKFAPTYFAIRRKPIRLCCVAIELIAWEVLLALWTPFIRLIASHILCLARRYLGGTPWYLTITLSSTQNADNKACTPPQLLLGKTHLYSILGQHRSYYFDESHVSTYPAVSIAG